MPTYVEVSARLLKDAADFFYTLGEQNPSLMDQMQDNIDVFRQMAALLVQNPQEELGDTPVSELASRLLKDSATFFTTLAHQNPPIKDQMLQNAQVYNQMGDLLFQNPLGSLE